ncbi:oligosaccharide flippase family protein [Hydrogenophaga sp. XSHU_21]
MTQVHSTDPSEHGPAGTAIQLGSKARSGTIWIVSAFGAGQVVRLATNIALAALLFEEAFALMALVTAVMVGLAMFSDVGLQQNVIQSPRGDEPTFLNTAWTIQVIRGGVLTSLAVALAWPVANFYGANDPKAFELRWLIPIVALTALFDGLRSPAALTAARHIRVGEVMRIEIGVTIFNTVLMLLLAWQTRSVYALAITAAVSSAVHCVATYLFLSGPRPRLALESSAVRAILSFGKWIFLSTVLYFLAGQIDRLTFASMYPLADVGVYSIAAGLAMIVPNVVGKLQSAIVFPYYSRLLEQGIELPVAFARATMPVLLASTYFAVLLIAGADSFFNLAYDHRYAEAGLMLPILALSVWFSNLGGLYGTAFLAKGVPQWLAAASAVKVVSFCILFPLFHQFEGGILMGCFAVVASDIATAMLSRWLGYRLGLKAFRAEAALLAALLLLSMACLSALHFIKPLAELHPLLRLALIGTFVTLVFLPFLVKHLLPMLRRRAG